MHVERWSDDRGRAWTIERPTTRRERRSGLLGRATMPAARGLFLARCRSVHTVGMRFPIDAVLLDRGLRVVAVVPMPPGRLLRPRRRVAHVLETVAGAGLEPGDRLVPDGPAPEGSRPGPLLSFLGWPRGRSEPAPIV